MSRRMTLRRSDGQVYLDRWGVECRWLGVFLHKMSAPDPGLDLHDHPWTFASLILRGGYTEQRADVRGASARAAHVDSAGPLTFIGRGEVQHRRRWSLRVMRLDECHRITKLDRATCWTVVVHGPKRRTWGFYLPAGWMHWQTYDRTVRAERRDLWDELDDSRGQVGAP